MAVVTIVIFLLWMLLLPVLLSACSVGLLLPAITKLYGASGDHDTDDVTC